MVTPAFNFPTGALPPQAQPTAHLFSMRPEAQQQRPKRYRFGFAGRQRNQVIYNDCVGQTTADIVEDLIDRSRGPGLAGSVQLEEAFPWVGAQLTEGTAGQNVGVDVHDALTFVRRHGCAAVPTMPQNVYSEIPTPAQADAPAHGLGITFQRCASVDELLTAMAAFDVPGSLAIRIWPEFERPNADGSIPAFTSPPLDSWHNIRVEGYDDERRVATLKNWWWPWTADGFFTFTYDQLEQCFADGYVLQLPGTVEPIQPVEPTPVEPTIEPEPEPTPEPEPEPTPAPEPAPQNELTADQLDAIKSLREFVRWAFENEPGAYAWLLMQHGEEFFDFTAAADALDNEIIGRWRSYAEQQGVLA